MKKKYREAAKFYAQSSKTFEEVTLRFIQENLFTCLIDYLVKVLDTILLKPDQEQCKPQKLLLCTWIVELKLNEINDISSSRESDRLTAREKEQLEADYNAKMDAFRAFLDKHKENVNEETIF